MSGPIDTYATSGTSPTTIHLFGPGAVGREVLARLEASPYRLVAVTDRDATLYSPLGLDPRSIARFKERGLSLSEFPGALALTDGAAARHVRADAVLDCTPSDAGSARRASDRAWAAFASGSRLIVAAKRALAGDADRWLSEEFRVGFGCNAALGGTGRQLQRDIATLRERCEEIAIVGNASTTVILEALAAGASLDEALVTAGDRLEPDPESDLRGDDLAVKLAIVVGAVSGHACDPQTIDDVDLRALDGAAIEAGTRLVGRWRRGEAPRLEVGAFAPHDPLRADADRVVYRYRLDSGHVLEHRGEGLGALRTAEALWRDLDALFPTADCEGSNGRVPIVRGSVTLDDDGSRLAFRAEGDLNAPATVVLGGISADREAGGDHGWWCDQVGPLWRRS